MQCPECQGNLKVDAERCACGWVKPRPGQPAVVKQKPKCNRCPDDAQLSMTIKGQRVNLCQACAMEQRNTEARAANAARGIYTTQDAKKWLADNKLMVKRQPIMHERQPGEDDE